MNYETGTYTLNTAPMAHQGWQFADWADTVLRAAGAIRRGDRELLDNREWLAEALTASRRLSEALTAIDDELLIAARNAEPPLTWRGLGDALDRHWTSVRERLDRLDQGKRAIKRRWLLGPKACR